MALTQVPASMLQDNGAILGMVNRIINGRMEIDQLDTASGAVTATDGGYQIDMYQTFTQAGEGAFTVQKVTDAPAGFKSSAKITVTTADASIGASQRYLFLHNIEGRDIADLNFGSANAQAVTVSFWVKSSVAGAHSGALNNAGFNRCYPFSITVNTANTWEQKFLNIAGDTSGTWLSDNSVGMRVVFDLGSGTSQRGAANAWGTAGFGVTGAVSLISTVNATMNITGLDVRKGTYASAPPAEWRPIGAEIVLCQRYFEKSWPLGTAVGAANEYGSITTGSENTSAATGTAYVFGRRNWKTEKRTTPTVVLYDLLGASGAVSGDVYGVAQYHGQAVFISGMSETSAALGRTGSGGTRNAINTCTFHYTSSARL